MKKKGKRKKDPSSVLLLATCLLEPIMKRWGFGSKTPEIR
jgi:hypothetical protein